MTENGDILLVSILLVSSLLAGQNCKSRNCEDVRKVKVWEGAVTENLRNGEEGSSDKCQAVKGSV